MNLTKFENSSPKPYNFPQTPSVTPTPIEAKESKILYSLGNKIQNSTNLFTSSKKVDPSRVKNFEVLKQELQSIFSRTSNLMQKSYNDDSSSISQEVEELENEVKDLESEFAKSLAENEYGKLLDITKDFHHILQSAESYLSFKERFLIVDEKLSGSLETLPPSIYSDLHGWSPSAASGAIQSLDQMNTLILIESVVPNSCR